MKPMHRSQQPGFGPVAGGLTLLLGLLLAWGAYELGQMRGGHNRFEASEREAGLLAELNELRTANAGLTEQVALLETDSKVKAEAYRQVEARLGELQATIQDQAEDIAFYRGIVGDQTSGLRVQDFGIFPGAVPENVSLRLVLAQALRDGRRIKGTVELSVQGQRDGRSEELNLRDLGVEGSGRLSFSFRYFQNLQADLRLPADFAPESVTVRIRPSSKGVEPIEASFDWELQRG